MHGIFFVDRLWYMKQSENCLVGFYVLPSRIGLGDRRVTSLATALLL